MEKSTPSSGTPRHWVDDADRIRRWCEFSIERARRYEVLLPGEPDEKTHLLVNPLFHHGISGHPGDWGVTFGPVVLWVEQHGRPVLVADLMVYPDTKSNQPVMLHEFHSLVAEPLSVELKAEKKWSWQTPVGIQWKPVPNAPVPAESSVARLRQMRQFCERFRVDAIDHKQGRWEYRLIPRPVYRYEPKDDPAVLDGAMFLFCEGSDPELILMIESRRSDQPGRWHYALASLSGWEVHGRLDGVEVWSQPAPVGPDRPGAAHFSTRTTGVRLPEEKSPP